MVHELDEEDIGSIWVIAIFSTRERTKMDIKVRNMGGITPGSQFGAGGHFATSEITLNSELLSLHMMNILCLI